MVTLSQGYGSMRITITCLVVHKLSSDIYVIIIHICCNLRIHCCHKIQQIITKLKEFIQNTTKEALQIKTISVSTYLHVVIYV